MMASNSKRQNISEEESCVVDIISNLADSLLSHILSFLPTTNEAVATSILSKRWRYVWTFVDKLIFDYSGPLAYTKKHHARFVYKVLKHHQGNIKSFTLSSHDDVFNECDVISWIDNAVSRGVETLHVDTSFNDVWPLSIFSCKTLVDLSMWWIGVDIPSTPIFLCLKKLQVMYCYPEFFRHIVSRCSALEHLIVGFTPSQCAIVSSSMKRLDLRCITRQYMHQKIALCVPSLEYLTLFCALPFELIAEEQLSSLIEADLCFLEYLYHSQNVNAEELRDSFVRFIQPISNVKLLRIKFQCNKFFNSVGHGLFVNLIKLEIVSSFFEWRLLLSFMESSINLETITLEKTSTLKKHKLPWKEPKTVPTSLSLSLRKISIHGYSEEELPMVKYVLRSAQILEQVNIHCALIYKDNNGWKSDMLRNLQKFHRACERCEIVVV